MKTAPTRRRELAVAAVFLWLGPLAAVSTPQAPSDCPPDRAWIRLFPVAGVPGEDFYVGRLFDRDPSRGSARDFRGGSKTYDGHCGTDFCLTGFPAMEIGVPVVAVREGTVLATSDGRDDHQTANLRGRLGNSITIDHGGGRATYYGHLKKGSIQVQRGQHVHAGQQIAEVGSSGDSSGPHLHFECFEDRKRIDPFAPPDEPAQSRWVRQPLYEYPEKTIDAGITLGQIKGPLETPRSCFVREGAERIHFWIVTLNQPAGDTRRWELLRPDGSVSLTWNETVGQTNNLYQSWWWVEGRGLSRGTWTMRVVHDRKVAAIVPLVVLGPTEHAPPNRAPSRLRAALFPRVPTVDEPVACRVDFPGVAADPDLDRARYRYVWSVDGRVVRDATTAVRADYLPASTAAPRAALRCQVFATDGRLASPQATLSARFRN